MKNRNQQVFKGLMERLEKKSNKEKFNEWMRNKVKSVHFSDNDQMLKAYNRIIEFKA